MIKTKTEEKTIENTFSHFEEMLEQFDKHMPYDGDYNLSILKGHLLVQERLWGILKRRLPNHDVLANSTKPIEFYTLMLFAQALVQHEDAEINNAAWIWKAVTGLNSLRNKIAHNLEYSGLLDKMQDVSSLVPEQLSNDQDIVQKFYYACAQMCTALTSLEVPIDWTEVEIEIEK